MRPHVEIRPARLSDSDAITRLAVSNHMFEPEEFHGVLETLHGSLDGTMPGHHWLIATDPGDRPVAAAYYAPEPFADRVWNLRFIAVDPDRHGSGAGTQLLAHLHNGLRDRGEDGARVLIVETSSTSSYQGARSFYLARGFDEEARIRDYYGPGDDKVVFWKSLLSS